MHETVTNKYVSQQYLTTTELLVPVFTGKGAKYISFPGSLLYFKA